MKIGLGDIQQLSTDVLTRIGLPRELAESATTNMLEAEMAGKKSHGFIRVSSIKEQIDGGKLNLNPADMVIEESGNRTAIHCKNLPAYYPYYKSLEVSVRLASKFPITITTLQDVGFASGFIGSYAMRATEKDLIFISFNNSPGGLVPHGGTKEIWGTDPITVGIPTNDLPVILDMASSKISWGELLVAKNQGRQLPEGVAIDNQGNLTTEPEKAMKGGLLPIAGHKGSGLAFIVELLSGALSESRIGYSVGNSWGSGMYILINPSFFRPLSDFKKDVETAINELKETPKQPGLQELYFPGEQSQKMFRAAKQLGSVDVDDKILNGMRTLLGH